MIECEVASPPPSAPCFDVVLAESESFETVEGNIYFPLSSLNREYFTESATTTGCHWKGTSNYFTVQVNGKENPDAAWYYSDPKPAADNIRDHVAFWRGIEVSA